MDSVPTERIPAGCTISDAVRAERAAGQDPAQCDAVMAWPQQDKTSDRRKVWISWLEQLAHDQLVAQMAREAALADVMRPDAASGLTNGTIAGPHIPGIVCADDLI